jgi:hypothetical protein
MVGWFGNAELEEHLKECGRILIEFDSITLSDNLQNGMRCRNHSCSFMPRVVVWFMLSSAQHNTECWNFTRCI